MAHVNTIFHQLLLLIDRHDFRRLETKRFKPKRKYRTLNRWDQFVIMIYAQITHRKSLRDIVNNLFFCYLRLFCVYIFPLKKQHTIRDSVNHR